MLYESKDLGLDSSSSDEDGEGGEDGLDHGLEASAPALATAAPALGAAPSAFGGLGLESDDDDFEFTGGNRGGVHPRAHPHSAAAAASAPPGPSSAAHATDLAYGDLAAAIEAGFAPYFISTEELRRFAAFIALRPAELDDIPVNDREARRALKEKHGKKALLSMRNEVLATARTARQNEPGSVVPFAQICEIVVSNTVPSLFDGAQKGRLDSTQVAKDLATMLAMRGANVETAPPLGETLKHERDEREARASKTSQPSINCSVREAEEAKQTMIMALNVKRARPARVCIIGAGPAGLSCANALQSAFPDSNEVEVVVLEARARPGGRVCTIRPTPMDEDDIGANNLPEARDSTAYTDVGLSIPVDLGAMLVTGTKTDVDTGVRRDPSTTTLEQLGRRAHVLSTGSDSCPMFDSDPHLPPGSAGEEVIALLKDELDAKKRREEAEREQHNAADGVSDELNVVPSVSERTPFHDREVPRVADEAGMYMFNRLMDAARERVDKHPDKEAGCINETMEEALSRAMVDEERRIKIAVESKREREKLFLPGRRNAHGDTDNAKAPASFFKIERKKDPSSQAAPSTAPVSDSAAEDGRGKNFVVKLETGHPKDEAVDGGAAAAPAPAPTAASVEPKQEKQGGGSGGPSEPHAPQNGNEHATTASNQQQPLIPSLLRRLTSWHRANGEYGCASVFGDVSLAYWNQDEQFGAFAGEHHLVVDGYNAVTDAMASRLYPGTVRYRCPVTRVTWGGAETANESDYPCTVEYAPEGSDALPCDAVVLAVPLGVLQRSCTFTRDAASSQAPPVGAFRMVPSLPQWKYGAISRLGMGQLDKIFLEFPEDSAVFWDDSVDYFGVTDVNDVSLRDDGSCDTRGKCFMFWNVHRYTSGAAKVLGALVVGGAPSDLTESDPDGSFARDASIASERQTARLRDVALTKLRSIFGVASVPDPVRCIASSWGDDPFARGAYSFVKVGSHGGTDYDLTSAPVGTSLFFAGEHTSKEHLDTVGGAILTGQREASRIELLLRKSGVRLGHQKFPVGSRGGTAAALDASASPEDALKYLRGDDVNFAVGLEPPFVEAGFWSWCGNDYTLETTKDGDDGGDGGFESDLSDLSDSDLLDDDSDDSDSHERGHAVARPAKRAKTEKHGHDDDRPQDTPEEVARRRAELRKFREQLHETGYDNIGFGCANPKPKLLLELLVRNSTKNHSKRLSLALEGASRCTPKAVHLFFSSFACAREYAEVLSNLHRDIRHTSSSRETTAPVRAFNAALDFVKAWKPWEVVSANPAGMPGFATKDHVGVDDLRLTAQSAPDVLEGYIKRSNLLETLGDIEKYSSDPEHRQAVAAARAMWTKRTGAAEDVADMEEEKKWHEELVKREKEKMLKKQELLKEASKSENVIAENKAAESLEAAYNQAQEQVKAAAQQRAAEAEARKASAGETAANPFSFSKFYASQREENREARREMKRRRQELKAKARAEKASAAGAGDLDATASAAALAAELAAEEPAAEEPAAPAVQPESPAAAEEEEAAGAAEAGQHANGSEQSAYPAVLMQCKRHAKKELAQYVNDVITELRKPSGGQAAVELAKDVWKEIARKAVEKVIDKAQSKLEEWAKKESKLVESGKAPGPKEGESFKFKNRLKLLEESGRRDKVRDLVKGYAQKFSKMKK